MSSFKKKIFIIFYLLFILFFIFIFFAFKLNKFFTYENINYVKIYFKKFLLFGNFFILFLFIVFNLALFPTFYFIFLSGYLYGSINGFFLAWFGMIIGLSASFINARYLFKEKFKIKFGKTFIIEQMEEYIKKHHGLTVFFFRVFFIIPYNFQNPVFGLTSIKVYSYIIFSAIGILPTTILYAVLGDCFSRNLINLYDLKKILLLIFIFILVFILFFFTAFLLRKKLKISLK